MKNKYLTILFAWFICVPLLSQEIILEGTYRGENLKLQNSGFQGSTCIKSISLNGNIYKCDLKKNIVEIDFSKHGIMLDSKVILRVGYHDKKPKVLNESAIMPQSTFSVSSIEITKSGILIWSTTNENGKLPFIVEQYRWNKWKRAGTVNGKGTSGPNRYSMKVNLHSGINRFRVKQIDYTKVPRYSEEAVIRTLNSPVRFEVISEIKFSTVTTYELFDKNGKLLLSGTGSKIDISEFSKGNYYLNYDNTTVEIIK